MLLEAWAEGTAALFADVPGYRATAGTCDALADCVADHDPDRWAARLRDALADRVHLERERREGPVRVAAHFSPRVVAERVAAGYRAATLHQPTEPITR